MWNAPAPSFTATLRSVPGGDAGSLETVAVMRALVNAAKVDPYILNFAVSVVFQEPQQDEAAEVGAIFNYVRGFVRYVRDVVGIESVSTPHMSIMRRVGDCDDKAVLLASLLEAIGYPTRFVLAAYRGHAFEHVYTQVYFRDGWVSLDPTIMQPWGYEAPGALRLWIEKV